MSHYITSFRLFVPQTRRCIIEMASTTTFLRRCSSHSHYKANSLMSPIHLRAVFSRSSFLLHPKPLSSQSALNSFIRPKVVEVDEEKWKKIYKFKHIVAARAIQRLKIYQTIFTCGIVGPVMLLSVAMGSSSTGTLIFTLSTCGLACSMLYLMGTFFSRLIGIIYVSKTDNQLVRVAHLTFWGSREDEVSPKSDFQPISDTSEKLGDVYVKVKRYSDSDADKPLYISIRYGEIYDLDELESIFGNMPELIVKSKADKSN